MNIEESIEILKGFEPDDLVECAIYLQALEKITNLIEKQSKEIEELKAKNKILEVISLSFNEIQDRDKKWKDKIKAILEEYKHTEIGDSEKIIEFYKKIQSLLKKE